LIKPTGPATVWAKDFLLHELRDLLGCLALAVVLASLAGCCRRRRFVPPAAHGPERPGRQPAPGMHAPPWCIATAPACPTHSGPARDRAHRHLRPGRLHAGWRPPYPGKPPTAISAACPYNAATTPRWAVRSRNAPGRSPPCFRLLAACALKTAPTQRGFRRLSSRTT